MPDLSITPADVKHISGKAPVTVVAGAPVTRGQALRRDASNSRFVPANADTSASAHVDGIALTDGQDGTEMLIAVPNTRLYIGADTDEGTAYVLSAAADGGIAPIDDLGDSEHPVFLFWGSGGGEVIFGALRSLVPTPPPE